LSIATHVLTSAVLLEFRSLGVGLAERRHRSEQYLTWSQSRSHFLRQLNGRAQWAQIFVGRSDFLRIFMATIVAPGLASRVAAARRRQVHSTH
jgi:hypothetical protein